MKDDTVELQLCAERTLSYGEGNPVHIRLYGPALVRNEDPGWACEVSISGLGDSSFTGRRVYGADGFEALDHANTIIVKVLDKFRERLDWDGGEKGGLGFGHHISDGFGIELYRRLNALIEQETTEFVKRKNQRR